MKRESGRDFNDLSPKARCVLGLVQRDAITINASGDIKVGQQVVTNGEQPLVAGLVALDVDFGHFPLGSDEREVQIERAVRISRWLGIKRV